MTVEEFWQTFLKETSLPADTVYTESFHFDLNEKSKTGFWHWSYAERSVQPAAAFMPSPHRATPFQSPATTASLQTGPARRAALSAPKALPAFRFGT